MKRVLMIAYHYPPDRISSGIQRALKFSRYLLDAEWLPSVLTVHPRAYQRTGDDQLHEIPREVNVKRAFAVDTARHLSVFGRYPLFLALPDRWSFWWFGAVWSGYWMIRRERPSALWSTYPIATAHLVALTLRRLTGLPWIADLRDSMTEDHYPRDPTVRRVYRWIERRVVEVADKVVFTTPSTMRLYAERYPHIDKDKWTVISNGYDEDNFRASTEKPSGSIGVGPCVLVHSGVLYPSERDPTQLFDALGELKRAGKISSDRLRIKLRATANDAVFEPMIRERDIGDIVTLEPSIPYADALQEMMHSDGLLLLQAASCNHQIPAKLYEYLRARRPLLGLTDQNGDTAGVMLEFGVSTIVPLDDKDQIKTGLMHFLQQIDSETAPLAALNAVEKYSRRSGTRLLAGLLDELVAKT